MVIRAVVERGQIRLLEPLPADWVEGRELRVLEAESGTAQGDEGDTWSREMDALTAEGNDPEDWARVEAVLAEANAKATGPRLIIEPTLHSRVGMPPGYRPVCLWHTSNQL